MRPAPDLTKTADQMTLGASHSKDRRASADYVSRFAALQVKRPAFSVNVLREVEPKMPA